MMDEEDKKMFGTALLIGLIGALSQWESRMMGEISVSSRW